MKVSVDKATLTKKREEFTNARQEADKLLLITNEKGPVFRKAQAEKLITALQVKLDEPNKKYQVYTTTLEALEQKRLVILGNEEAVGSFNHLKKQLADIEGVPAALAAAQQKRLEQAKRIHSEIKILSDAYRALYAPVHRFIEVRPLAKEKFQLNFEVAIVDTGFHTQFFSIVSHAIAGTFCGVEEGGKALRAVFAKHDLNQEPGVQAFLLEMMECLTTDRRAKEPSPCNIRALLRRGRSVLELYDTLFSLDYLRPRYTLRMADKELHQLSPGERGTLLLVFYLLIDKGDIPLVIDQPEENLDNQTVFELLVPCIKEAKERRQIIIVTHNPNLAVVCDAEEVIGANLDKQNNYSLEYISGAIENPRINKLILNILEGTRPAFANRDSKYLPD